MPTINFNNREIHYQWYSERQKLDQTAIVLINGITSDSRNFNELYETIIVKNIPVIAIDNTNVGRSTYIAEPISFEEQVEEIIAVLNREKVTNPLWVATSAAVGIACKAAHSYGAKGLMLGSPLFTCGNEIRLDLMRGLVSLALEDESMKQAMDAVCFLAIGASFLNKNPLTPYTALMIGRKLYNAKEFKVVWDQISGLNRDDKAVISDLDCPTIISYGREEMIQPLHTIEELFDRDSAKIVKFNTGHSILFEAKEQYLGLLEEFYNELAD